MLRVNTEKHLNANIFCRNSKMYLVSMQRNKLQHKDIDIVSKTMGNLLKFERMSQHISIAKMAKDLSINPSTIVSIEDAKHHSSFLIIYSMIQYLKIDQLTFFEKIALDESSS